VLLTASPALNPPAYIRPERVCPRLIDLWTSDTHIRKGFETGLCGGEKLSIHKTLARPVI